MIHASQIRGARGVSAATVKRIESAAEIRGAADTLWKIEKALETAGVEFIDADGIKGPGVRLKVVPQVAQLKNRGRRERRRQK